MGDMKYPVVDNVEDAAKILRSGCGVGIDLSKSPWIMPGVQEMMDRIRAETWKALDSLIGIYNTADVRRAAAFDFERISIGVQTLDRMFRVSITEPYIADADIEEFRKQFNAFVNNSNAVTHVMSIIKDDIVENPCKEIQTRWQRIREDMRRMPDIDVDINSVSNEFDLATSIDQAAVIEHLYGKDDDADEVRAAIGKKQELGTGLEEIAIGTKFRYVGAPATVDEIFTIAGDVVTFQGVFNGNILFTASNAQRQNITCSLHPILFRECFTFA